MAIQFGNITITRERNEWKTDDISLLKCYKVTVDNGKEKPKTNMVYCDDIDKVILSALALKYEGMSRGFTEYAARMLEIDAPLWG